MQRIRPIIRSVLSAAAGMAFASMAGCVSPGKYWYETHWKDVRPSARTLENGPYQLIYKGHALWVLLDSDLGLYLTDGMRERVARWMSMSREEVDLPHLAWYCHRTAFEQRGSTYEYPVLFPEMPGKSYITSTAFTDIRRQLFNWLTWEKEGMYRGENRKELRFAYFIVLRELDGDSESDDTWGFEYWVCIFGKEGNVLKTVSSRALDRRRVESLRKPGVVGEKGKATVRIGNETVAMWNPSSLEEHDQWVVGALLVEALNAMDDEDFARLDHEEE